MFLHNICSIYCIYFTDKKYFIDKICFTWQNFFLAKLLLSVESILFVESILLIKYRSLVKSVLLVDYILYTETILLMRNLLQKLLWNTEILLMRISPVREFSPMRVFAEDLQARILLSNQPIEKMISMVKSGG